MYMLYICIVCTAYSNVFIAACCTPYIYVYSLHPTFMSPHTLLLMRTYLLWRLCCAVIAWLLISPQSLPRL